MEDAATSQQDLAALAKKRRFSRVSRACVECRVRKIRCDARQPCEPCEDFNRRCVYSSTKAQRTGGAPRTKILEDRLRRARALISQLQAEHPSVRHRAEINAIFDTPPGSPGSSATSVHNEESDNEDGGGNLENMMDGQGVFTAADQNNYTYYGGPSGFRFLEKTQQLFGDDSDGPGKPESPQHAALSHLFDAPLPDKQALTSGVSIAQLLPSRRTATRLLGVVFEQIHQLLRFLDEDWFHAHTDRIYDLDALEYTDSDHDFLPLFLGVVAIGYLFDPQRHKRYGCRRTIDQAMRHFIAARQMTDVTRCHDMVSLQTIMVFALFLMSTARLATAHTYIALAAAAAMRLGLHSQTTYGNFDENENRTRRRLLWTIVKLDIYTGTILGLPGLVNLSHVDQVRPSGRMEDYLLTSDGKPTTRDQQRMLAASAQYRDLLLIIAAMVQKLFPKTEQEAKQVRKSKRMLINSTVIAEVEKQFKTWRDALPEALGVHVEPESPLLKSTLYELEIAHNLGHILLYRPFLHYLARSRGDNTADQRQLKCASACVKISRETITRSDEMLRQGFLAPAAWQSVYTIFLAIVALIFYLATQKGEPEYETVEVEARIGIRVLASTSCQDIGSKRCLDVLKVLVKRLSHIIDLDIESIEQNTVYFCQSDIHMMPSKGRSMSHDFTEPPSVASSVDSPRMDQTAVPPHQTPASIPPHMSQSHVLHSNADQTMPAVQVPMHIPQPPRSQPHHHQQHQHQQQPQHYPHPHHHHQQQQQHHQPLPQHMTNTHIAHIPDLAHAHSMYPSNETDFLLAQHDMEVPFSDTFAWPFDPNINLASQQMAAASMSSSQSDMMHGGQGMGGASGGYAHQPHAAHSGHMQSMGMQHGRGHGAQQQPTSLTSEDIAAFMMRINPGEEPFL